jgi:tetratricopeptide (TPR) repeat protein
MLHISARQLMGWEKAGLIQESDSYSFYDLLQIKKLSELKSKRVRPAVIRASLDAMQRQVSGMQNPLIEAGVSSNGSRVTFRHDGMHFDPLAGQFVFNFERPRVVEARPAVVRPAESASELFALAVSMEDDATRHAEAQQIYVRVLELDPKHAAACINLGTLFYNQQNYREAERYYRRAVEIDPRYALAWFDLGNVLDETGRLEEAVEAYRRAIQISSTYADAHYNLALAYERLRRSRKAIGHWKAYIKLDPASAWSNYARAQVRKILAAERLRIVWRRGSH